MSQQNLKYWNELKHVPEDRLKKIEGGRLKGKSDINPQWRYEALTSLFGPCGIGWKFEIARLWTEPGSAGQVISCAIVNLYFRHDGEWSEPIPGQGGSMLIEQESKGLYTSDEGYKMAITDALGTAAKMIGVAAEVYLGQADGGGKYEKKGQADGGGGTETEKKWLNPKTSDWEKMVEVGATAKRIQPTITGKEIIQSIVDNGYSISKVNQTNILNEILSKV